MKNTILIVIAVIFAAKVLGVLMTHLIGSLPRFRADLVKNAEARFGKLSESELGRVDEIVESTRARPSVVGFYALIVILCLYFAQ